MARKDPVATKLAAVAALADDPHGPAAEQALRAALADKSNLVAAAAARIAGAAALGELADDLVAAFERFMIDPGKTDKTCAAKAAIADALARLGHPDPDVFVRGVRHVQMEPIWGGQKDTAPGLRAACGAGLTGTYYHDTLGALAELLADPEIEARAGAATALGALAGDGAAALLRHRVLAGDESVAVMGACFASLLAQGVAGVELVSRFLDSGRDEIAEAAALAIGEARPEGGFEALRDSIDPLTSSGRLRVTLLAIALLRSDAGFDYLIAQIEDEPPEVARLAITALATFKYDTDLGERAAAAAADRGAELRRAVREAFASD